MKAFATAPTTFAKQTHLVTHHHAPYKLFDWMDWMDLGGPFFLDSYSMSPRSFRETKAGFGVME